MHTELLHLDNAGLLLQLRLSLEIDVLFVVEVECPDANSVVVGCNQIHKTPTSILGTRSVVELGHLRCVEGKPLAQRNRHARKHKFLGQLRLCVLQAASSFRDAVAELGGREVPSGMVPERLREEGRRHVADVLRRREGGELGFAGACQTEGAVFLVTPRHLDKIGRDGLQPTMSDRGHHGQHFRICILEQLSAVVGERHRPAREGIGCRRFEQLNHSLGSEVVHRRKDVLGDIDP
mmetsp:Transcript_25253/g.58178  ORF Transcript_25253/g.58178 Transcript_25253/m.58178 type:complete len:236 (-) Transcript_25253:571-1278(-)